MRNIKLTLAYDGSEFHGWQLQPHLPTIQGALADVARQITQEKVFIHGASRTDAGVHALGQVAHFRTRSALTATQFQCAFNALLPPQIRVMEAEEVGPDFHARWQPLAKTYEYRIFRGQVVPPFEHRRVLHVPWSLDEALMIEAARAFEGEHDFTAFSASPDSEDDERDRNMVREIYHSEIARISQQHSNGDRALAARSTETGKQAIAPPSDALPYELTYIVRGRSFLRYMVRKMVGTLLEVGKGRLRPSDIPALFESRDRSRSGPTVPPDGLYLVSLEYPDPTSSLAIRSRRWRERASDSQ